MCTKASFECAGAGIASSSLKRSIQATNKPSYRYDSYRLIATEPGRDLRERMVKIGIWDDLHNLEKQSLVGNYMARIMQIGKRRRDPLLLKEMDFA